MDDVPSLLKSEIVKNVEKVLSVVLASLPTNFSEFIKWVAEVRRQDDGALTKEEKGRLSVKEDVLKQVRETALYKHVNEWMLSANPCCQAISSLGDKDTLPEIAARVCCQGAEMLIGNLGSSHGFCCRETCVKCVKANGDTSVTMVSGTVVRGTSEQGVDMLVPSGSGPDSCSCTGMHPASKDILTALLLALPPKTFRDSEKLHSEICDLVKAHDV